MNIRDMYDSKEMHERFLTFAGATVLRAAGTAVGVSYFRVRVGVGSALAATAASLAAIILGQVTFVD